MIPQAETWEILDSDVLIVGGGFGGLWAALRASECGASVTLVDKSFAGKSGHSYFAGGAMMVLLPEDDLDVYVQEVVAGNDGLIDQEMVTAVFRGSYQRLQDLESFGMAFRRSGSAYVWTRARGTRQVKNLWPERGTAADEVTLLRRVALSRGVRIVNHVYVYDLARDGRGRISGALGVGVKEPRDFFFKAKSTILATNTGSYRGHHLACELQGTGPFMAYHAGAEVENAEFHYINMRPVRHEIEGSGILPAIGAKWRNGQGDAFMKHYDPVLADRAPVYKIVVAAAREVLRGRGPIFIDVEGMNEEEREKFQTLQVSHGWMPLLFQKCEREEGYHPLRQNVEWQPAYEANRLAIRCDLHCRTSLEGVFAAGMARNLGINSFTGWSIASCTWSGYTAGEGASACARNTLVTEIDWSSVEEKRAAFLNPLESKGGIHPDDLVLELQKILFPARVLIIMSEANLQEALGEVMQLKAEKGAALKARNMREVIKAREAETMMLSAEMTLRASIMRKETRENLFYREDYPNPDDRNWLKWIVVNKGDKGELQFRTEDVPFDRYLFRPPHLQG